MPLSAPKERGNTYADYLTWPAEERWEIIEGVVFDMTPAPSPGHQRILGRLHLAIGPRLEGRSRQVFLAPFDVRLPEGDRTADEAIESVVQPDLLVICDPAKIDDRGCLGAPGLVVEILSPSTAYKDQTSKLMLYEKHGVREYWIVNPGLGSILVYRLEPAGRFSRPLELRRGERLASTAVAEVEVELDAIF